MTKPEEYIVVTGGLGYIGSHTVIQLLQSNHKVIILDNLINSNIETLERIKNVLNFKDNDLYNDKLTFYEVDVRNYNELINVFKKIIERIVDPLLINSLIHFAGLKSVSESVLNPIEYYETNFIGTLNILKLLSLKQLGLKNLKQFIFSSSATIYGDVKLNGFDIPIKETTPFLVPTSPYGESKLMVEKALKQFIESKENFGLKIGILRYFNPIGAHHSGLIGEDSKGNPTNLLPILGNIAIDSIKSKNQLDEEDKELFINVFGNDYDTLDGTPIRDYIHIEDLSNGHISCLNYLKNINKNKTDDENSGFYREWNLGTGKGLTVLEILDKFNKNIKGIKKINSNISERRPGDVEVLLADPSRANKELKWNCVKDVDDACKDLWRWLKYLHDLE